MNFGDERKIIGNKRIIFGDERIILGTKGQFSEIRRITARLINNIMLL